MLNSVINSLQPLFQVVRIIPRSFEQSIIICDLMKITVKKDLSLLKVAI
jgi:hypothetical protein